MIHALFVLIILLVVLSILFWLVGKAPFLAPIAKTVIQWLLVAIGALFCIDFLLMLAGQPPLVPGIRWK